MKEGLDKMENTDSNLPAGRLIGLDLFRIFAVLVIFFFHTGHIGCSYGLLRGFIGQGAIFMTAFFMLSGFALYHTNSAVKLAEPRSMRKFYTKRFISVVPCYWVVAIAYTAYSVVHAGGNLLDSLVLAPIEALGLQSVFCSVFNMSHNGGTWFVSCILLCYAVFPILQLLIKEFAMRYRIILYLVLTAVLLYSPIVVSVLNLDNIYSNPFFRICEFALGAVLCSIWQTIKSLRWYNKYIASYWAVLAETVMLVGGVSVAQLLHIPSVNYMLYSWIGIPCFTLMLLSLCGLKFAPVNGSRFLRYCVDSSYVFFFAQFFTWPICSAIFKPTGGTAEVSTLIKVPVAVVVCCLITVTIHEAIEKPVTKKLKLLLLK